jgi:hypothetical protein
LGHDDPPGKIGGQPWFRRNAPADHKIFMSERGTIWRAPSTWPGRANASEYK